MTSQNSQIITAKLSKSLRTFRQQRGMSLVSLADRAKVSRSMIIQIEQGRTNPSLGILVQIAEALDISLGELLDLQECESVRILAPESGPIMWIGEHGGQGRILTGSNQLEVWDWRMNPNDCFMARSQSQGSVEIIHVLDGQLTLTIGDDVREVSAGSTAIFHPDRPHGYANIGSQPLRMIISNSEPPSGFGPTKEILDETT